MLKKNTSRDAFRSPLKLCALIHHFLTPRISPPLFLFRALVIVWVVHIWWSNFICKLGSTMSKVFTAEPLSSLPRPGAPPAMSLMTSVSRIRRQARSNQSMKERAGWAGAARGLWEGVRDFQVGYPYQIAHIHSSNYFAWSLGMWLLYRAINKRWVEGCHLAFCNAWLSLWHTARVSDILVSKRHVVELPHVCWALCKLSECFLGTPFPKSWEESERESVRFWERIPIWRSREPGYDEIYGIDSWNILTWNLNRIWSSYSLSAFNYNSITPLPPPKQFNSSSVHCLARHHVTAEWATTFFTSTTTLHRPLVEGYSRILPLQQVVFMMSNII